ncbi:TPA: hypothetical protein EYP75_05455 [Candidatus Bathyarchaeota archaeon]|nr:hypothetical protein [Candidatus Bathyarchaeota archaeon]
MGLNERKIEDLLGRIDELIRILKFLTDDLSEISRILRTSLGSYVSSQEVSSSESLKPPVSAQQTIIPEEPSATQRISTGAITIENVQNLFPPDLVNLLYFEDTGEHIIVKPRQYLGSDNFRRIASIVRDQLSGEYISAGRDSHFRIPKT